MSSRKLFSPTSSVKLVLAGLVIAATAAAGAGCLDRDLKPLTPCTVSGVVTTVRENGVDKVDLLFLVDNSNSMTEEQTSLATQFPTLVTALATGDRDGDGTMDFPPVKDLHIGVASSDMGNGGYMVPTCNSMYGDDGVLITRGNRMDSGCMATYPSFLGFMPDAAGADAAQFARDVTCVAKLGTGGCGFEQHLDAVLKAITPSTSPVRFTNSTVGHADRENAGFLRPDSVVAIVVVADEDDCSTTDPALFATTAGSRYTGDLNLRCFKYPSVPYPIDRYTDLATGFRGIRPGRPDLVVFAAIVGIPTDLVADPRNLNYDAILADPRMQEREETVMSGGTTMGTGRLVPACADTGRGVAYPARRMTSVAREFGGNGLVQSICQADFSPALRAITDKLADVLGNVCLPRALNPKADGSVGCDVVVTLPAESTGGTDDYTQCDVWRDAMGLRGTVAFKRINNGREECVIHEVPDPDRDGPMGPQFTFPDGMTITEGWYYDNFSDVVISRCAATPQRIAFTTGAKPPSGSDIRLECLQPLQTVQGDNTGGIGSRCDPADGNADNMCSSMGAAAAVCDSGTRTCQIGCGNDSDCPSGFICDTTRPHNDYLGVCANPTCGS